MSLATIISGDREYLEAAVTGGYTLAVGDTATLRIHDRPDTPPFLVKTGSLDVPGQKVSFAILEADMDWYPTRHVYYAVHIVPINGSIGPFTLTSGHLRTRRVPVA